MAPLPWISSTANALVMAGLVLLIAGATLLWWRQRSHSARLQAQLTEANTQLGAVQRDTATGFFQRQLAVEAKLRRDGFKRQARRGTRHRQPHRC